MLATLVIGELSIRLGVFAAYGGSKYHLFYGYSPLMGERVGEGHTDIFDGYFKFPPNRELKQYGLYKDPTPIRINSQGFRSPDF